jgi:hypothetical protein
MKAYEIKCKYIKRVSELRNLRDIQKDCIYDGYTLGMYNSFELALAIMESREPVLLGYTDIKKKGSDNNENQLENQIKE